MLQGAWQKVKKQCQAVTCYFLILYSSPKTCCAAMKQLFKYTLKDQWDQGLKYFFANLFKSTSFLCLTEIFDLMKPWSPWLETWVI